MTTPEQVLLSNGIPVMLQHFDGPVASIYWWNSVGSVDEKRNEEGFAHFLEHMLFKDASAKETGKASTGQTAQAIEALGGDINAYTSFEQTVYHVTCAAQHMEKIIDAFGKTAQPQKFLKLDFEREREVILEELKKNEDSPSRQLFQNLFKSTFGAHPYARPVIGYAKTLKAAKVGNLETFYKRNYVSGKMGLIVVGPMESDRKKNIIKRLEKYFGSSVIKKNKAVVREKNSISKHHPSFTVKKFDVQTPTLSFAFRVPDLKHQDIPALDLLAGILGMGEVSRFYQKLFYQTSVATDVSASLFVPNDPGLLYFQADLENLEKVKHCSHEVFKEILHLQNHGPTQEEIDRIIVNNESEKIYARQTTDGMAGRIGYLRFILNDMGFDEKYLEQLRSVKSEDIQRVAREYLNYDGMCGVLLQPKSQSEYDFSETQMEAKTILKKSELKSKTHFVSGHKKSAQHFTLPSGVRVIFNERPETQVFSIHASVLGGVRLETIGPSGNWGASNLISLSWTKGTTDKDAKTISSFIEGSAAAMDGFSGRNTIGLQLTGLAKDWGKLSPLFSEVLLDPVFSESEVEHARRIAEDSIKSMDDHTAQLSSRLFLENLFERHPYGRVTVGSLETVSKIKSETLKKLHRMWVQPKRLVLSLSGSLNQKQLEKWLHDLDKNFKTDPSQNSSEILADEPVLKAPRWVEKSLGREQAHIFIGGLGTTLRSNDRFAIRLLNTLLGGQSGRLFIELREKKSLAYSVAPMSFEGIERGYVAGYIACALNKREEAVAGLKTVFESLAKKGPTPKEMERAREFYLGRRAMDLQSDSSLASNYGLESLYGVESIETEELIKKIKQVTSKEIQEVCKKYFLESHLVTSVVG